MEGDSDAVFITKRECANTKSFRDETSAFRDDEAD